MQTAPQAPAPKKRGAMFWILIVGGLGLGGVCALGILAAIAIPAFVNYTRRSKTVEAASNIGAIARAEENYCFEHGNYLFPAGPVPSSVPSGVKVPGDFSSDPTFQALGISFLDPLYYSYSITPQSVGVIAITAHGDLDGDGVQSTFETQCSAGCDCAEHMIIENETE